MNEKDYFFSLIYHTKIQKSESSEVYLNRLIEISNQIGMRDFKSDIIIDDANLAIVLSNFMRENFYYYTDPIDNNVFKNNSFLKKMDKRIFKPKKTTSPVHVKIISIFPRWIKNLFSKKFKKKLNLY